MEPIELTSETQVGNTRMRPLVIDDKAKKLAEEVRGFAEKPSQVYRPFWKTSPPGNDPRHCCHINTYRIVYSITEVPDDGLYRHLSVSVPSDKYPHPVCAFVIAELFGFTGWDGKSALPAADWVLRVSDIERCVIIAQRYRPTTLT